MTTYDQLLPPPPTITQVNVWATVTQASPLRIQIDGDPGALNMTPDSLVAGLVVNDRVRVELTTNTDPRFQGRRVVVIGRSGGTAVVNPFPVGAIYMSVDSTDPGTLFGGTWSALQDAFLIGAGNVYAVNATGGEATHVLTIAEMPGHNHPGAPGSLVSTGGGTYSLPNGSFYGFQNGSIGNTGGDGAHNNLPPYLAVYMWKRTA